MERNVAGYTLKTEALQMLLEHPWKGNIKELEKVLKSACVLAKDMIIGQDRLKYI
jgi:DNA-binding NtrC family response regulator